MAQLTANQRAKIHRAVMRAWSNSRTPIGITKADLLTGVNETDSWIDTNAAAFNLALTPTVRSGLTAAQKSVLFTTVSVVRYLIDNPAELAILQDVISQAIQEVQNG